LSLSRTGGAASVMAAQALFFMNWRRFIPSLKKSPGDAFRV
jgi:hypothetical protein